MPIPFHQGRGIRNHLEYAQEYGRFNEDGLHCR